MLIQQQLFFQHLKDIGLYVVHVIVVAHDYMKIDLQSNVAVV